MKIFIFLLIIHVSIICAEPDPGLYDDFVDLVKKVGNDVADKVSGAAHDVVNYFKPAWSSFKSLFGKTYKSKEEEEARLRVFAENCDRIQKSSKNLKFKQTFNEFTDIRPEEFKERFNGFGRKRRSSRHPIDNPKYFQGQPGPFPEEVDWRKTGAVSNVKFQDNCAACYAFSAAGALEGQMFTHAGKLEDISVQNIIDCSHEYGNDGCGGGLLEPAYQYIKNNGINLDKKYPFESTNGRCRFKKGRAVTKSAGFISIPSGDEELLKQAIATVGPISAAMDARLLSFQFYMSGIYFDPNCKNGLSDLNHAILIVGYGEENGVKYWLVKNSYGKNWGIDGYFKIVRNANNHCGIATLASFPLINGF